MNNKKSKALLLLLSSILILNAPMSSTVTAAAETMAETGTEGASKTKSGTEETSSLTEAQLKAKVNPVLQEYNFDTTKTIRKIDNKARFVVEATEQNLKNERLKEVIKLVNGEFVEKKIVDSPLSMAYSQPEKITEHDILIQLTDNVSTKTSSPEAYKIEIGQNGIVLSGVSENAILHGLRTMEALFLTNKGLVYGTIVDYPDVAERRVHVDCGRKYFTKDWFFQTIREMSYMKMNALQMHFSENRGFRIECGTDPAIVSDEHLTKAEVREIIAEANKYGIKIIPSFDTPGHTEWILKFHPEYGQKNTKGASSKIAWDVTNQKAVDYLYTLYDEYMELFQGCTDFHIGGDEYMEFDRPPFTTEYQSVLNQYATDNLGAGYQWKDVLAKYINDLAEHVYKKGFTPRIWNDGIYYGEDSPQKIEMHQYIGIDFWSQMSWNRSVAKLQTFIDKGHTNLYNVNASFFYYVLRNQKPTDGREQHSFDHLNADSKIYNEWTPGKFQENTISDTHESIKGASLAIWCDIPDVTTEDMITQDISKELRTLASKSWNTKSNSVADLQTFKENCEILGNAPYFTKGSVPISSGDFIAAEDPDKDNIKDPTLDNASSEKTKSSETSSEKENKVSDPTPAPAVPAPQKVKLKKVQAGRKSVSLYWKKSTNAEGYEVWMRLEKKKFKKVKSVSAQKTSIKFKKLKTGKKYSFKLKAYRKNAQKKKVYGAFSNIKSVKVK